MSQRRITLKVGLLMEWQGTVHSYFLMIQNIFGEGRGERTVQAPYSQETKLTSSLLESRLSHGSTRPSVFY